MASPALFVAAHPDDETLAMGVAVAEHLAAGQDVHVLWLTRGTSSGARDMLNGAVTSAWWGVPHNPAAEGFAPLDQAAFGAARIAEGTAAVRLLATGYPGTLTIHEAGLVDQSVTQADARAAIEAVCDLIAPGAEVRLKTHSAVVDNNPDHVAAGKAAAAMAAANPTRFGGPRYYILSDYWSDARLGQVAEMWDLPTDNGVKQRVINACRAYGAWQPQAGAYAVGWHSVPGMFGTITSTPKCLYHT